MLTTILSKVGLPILIEFVSQGLKKIDNPVAQSAADALSQVEGALTQGLISPEQLAEANRHAEAMAEINMMEYETSLEHVNKSLQAEISSDDKYIRRMRPTFGYLMALTWATQMFGLSYILIFKTEIAAQVMEGMAALSTIWAVGLSVLGVYVYKRSEDKKVFSTPIIQQIVKEIERPKQAPKIEMKKENSIYYNE